MPTIDEAIERAARAHCDFFGGEGWYDSGLAVDTLPTARKAMRAALSAFLADVPVSEGMEETYWTLCRDVSFPEPPPPHDAFKAMSAKLAEEIQ